MATTIIVPKTERGVDGFIANVHDALVKGRDVVFDENYPAAHTVVARILSEITPSIPPTTSGRTIEVAAGKTLILAFGKRYPLRTSKGEASKDIGKFKKDLERAVKSGRRIAFSGDHTVMARIYQHRVIRHHITNVLIKEIEKGGLPQWRKPWASQERPRSGRPNKYIYGAFNAFRLNSVALERGYTDPSWVTLEYARRDMGRPVRKAERGRGVSIVSVYPNPVVVYNLEQLEGARKTELRRSPTLQEADDIIDGYRKREGRLGLSFRAPASVSEMNRAVYFPYTDRIVMPPKHRFPNPSRYYMTAFHEIAHSTGHAKRRDRHDGDSKWAPFGSERYGREELVAEIAACLIASDTELARNFHRSEPLGHGGRNEVRMSSAAYLLSWLKGSNPGALWTASREADNAYKYALDMDDFRKESRDRAIKRERRRKALARKKR